MLVECAKTWGVMVTMFTGEGMSKCMRTVYWEEAAKGPHVSLLPQYQPAANTS